ncbi:MAG: hypothetical protein LBP34_01110 [Flavobacteriaceae bacterium]|nr:hypothetical protein [Flavobacteriaceae bacterium]
MIKIISCAFSFFILIGCENKEIKIKKYPSGDIHYKYYLTKSKVDSIEEYFEGSHALKMKITQISKEKEYVVHFDEKTGKDRVEGWSFFKKGKKYPYRNGWWTQIKSGKKAKAEYFTIGDTIKINQFYVYKSDGSIDLEKSHYYRINLPDTVEANNSYKFTVELVSPILGAKGYYVTILKLSDSIQSDFMNYWTAPNTYQYEKIETNLWEMNHRFTQKGNFIIRGFIFRSFLEFKKDSIKALEYTDIIYIKKKIYVK